jgi:hypothetical protein
MNPAPKSNGVAGAIWLVNCAKMGEPEWSNVLAVVIIADVIAAGLHLGCFCLIKAATPAM